MLAIAFCQHLVAQNTGTGDSSLHQSIVIPPVDTSHVPNESLFIVRNIVIVGNKKTKESILLRELPFRSGDKYLLQDIVKKFETGRKQLMNTALFHEVIVALKSFEGYNVDVLVQVKERWYIFPVPYFRPVDRNLNQWLVEQKASFKRVNYGAKLLYNNVTGRNDKLRIFLINGYTKQFSFSYDRLYFDKGMKWGINTGLAIGKNREMNYNSIDDKQVFFRDNENYVRNFFSTYTELTYRRAIRTRHRFGLAYTRETIADTIVKLNPSYFQTGRKRVEFPELYYIMNYYDLDYIPYPTKGYAAEIGASKRGLSKAVNMWQVYFKGSGYWPTGKRSFFSLSTVGVLKLPFSQPYFNQRLLGYQDVFMQGYEYYVVDGTAGAYVKASFSRRLLNFDFRIPGIKKLAPMRIPIKIYGKVYGNTGYIYNPNPGNNSLSNKMLFSSGIGLDIISIYDFTLKLEWSFNQLGQNGLFLHRRSLF
ncbi:MAG: POTRA domain-containing protein [Chitinophagaceae bacterium]